ncbi:MAG: hypothetical protein PHF86_01660 [Candidatus Nanoarchaeia archaeon]|nr:hypothetical protein [Candidatus Nanoarchaeia archaeon]
MATIINLTSIIGKKKILLDAWAWCDKENKSTEYMLQYMADVSGVDYDEVVDFVIKEGEKRNMLEENKLYKKLKK